MATRNCSDLSLLSILLSVRLSGLSPPFRNVKVKITFCKSFHSQFHFHKCL
ncbi:unnamed protein product [Hymenolepis diminuta]|uniref:Uncharacterized protein n=1 Tax=Hymenolepis diminuta TaxID=6216 RepID=A0A564Y0J9_HYMDI|nr:unnamed protein product [Hymenolepis diminuta]